MYAAFQLAKKYLQYYLRASNSKGHSVHSPFVFDFIKFVKNDKTAYPVYKPIEAQRTKLLSNHTTIDVMDFGAGSTLLKSNRRAINKIAASSLKPKKYAQLLFRIVQYYKPKTIVELGTSFGITSAYLASGHSSTMLYSLEGSPSIAQIARENFKTLGLNNIELIEGEFNQTFPKLLQQIGNADLFFVDGNHRKEPTLGYFEQILKHAHTNSIIIFDDIHWSAEMEIAWAKIIEHEAVTLSIDLFFIGIVWMKKEFKVKQQFSIRF